jgi:hypothetical protein
MGNKDKTEVYDEETIIQMSISGKERYILDDNHAFKTSPNRIPWNKGLKTGPQSEEEKRKNQKH